MGLDVRAVERPLIASPADLQTLSGRRVLFRTCRNKHGSQHAKSKMQKHYNIYHYND